MTDTETFDELLIGSASTAVAVAIVRAEESLKPDRLYEDPWAATFVARAQRANLYSVTCRRPTASNGSPSLPISPTATGASV